ncbi:MAG: GIY-YIG nuclease family protein [Bacteroidetes bacterium]|nr:GIY-YIG nuclease family protein [Bacteroidota bacterium]
MKGYMYILQCADGSYYTGSTNDLERRFEQHQNGEGANHTKKRLPVKLVYFEEFSRIDEAFYREKQVQGWSRAKKEALINNRRELLKSLAECKNESHFSNAAFDSAQAAADCSLSGAETNSNDEIL